MAPLPEVAPPPGPRGASRDGVGFDDWQALISDTFVPLTATRVADAPFRGRLAHRSAGPLELTSVLADDQVVRRTPRLISRSDEQFLLASIQVAGEGEVEQAGRTAVLQPGAMAFYDSGRPYTLRFAGPFHQLVLQVPVRVVADARIDRATAVTLPADGAGRVVTDFFRGLAALATRDPESTSTLVPHALGLLGGALGLVDGSGCERATDDLDRRRVTRFVLDHLDRVDLCADDVAHACAMSRRALFRMFEHQDESFAALVRRLRVDRARQLLSTRPDLPVAAVAAHVGFSDAAQLHRVFRASTGTTPGAYRTETVAAPRD